MLRDLVDALDRRIPNAERAGEARIRGLTTSVSEEVTRRAGQNGQPAAEM